MLFAMVNNPYALCVDSSNSSTQINDTFEIVERDWTNNFTNLLLLLLYYT